MNIGSFLKGKAIKRITVLFYILFLIIGILYVKDYGISCDEPIQRQHYLINSKYVYQVFFGDDNIPKALQNQADLKNYSWKYYGVSVRIPLFLIEAFNDFELSNETVYFITHLYNFILFFIAAIYLRRILKLLNFNDIYACVGVVFFVVCPRIFADAFYNIKDSVFLSLFTVMLYYGLAVIEKLTIKRAAGLVISSAFVVNCRVVAGLPLVIIAFCYLLKDYKFNGKRLKNAILIIFLSVALYLIITPAAWESPIKYIQGVLTTFSDFNSWHSTIGLINTSYDSAKLPWYYTILCMAITLPTLYTVLGITGVVWIVGRLIKSNNIREEIRKNYLLYILLFQFIIIILYDMIMSPTKYNLWRHMYFLFSYLIVICVYALNAIIDVAKRYEKRRYRWIIIVLTGISVCCTALWMIFNHPFEYLYFNPLYATNSKELTERDYWNTSGQNVLKKYAKLHDEGFYDVWSDLNTASLYFGEDGWEMFHKNNQENEARYALKYYSNTKNKVLYDVVYSLEVCGRESTYLLRRKNFDNCIARYQINKDSEIKVGSGTSTEIEISVCNEKNRRELIFQIPENGMPEEVDILFPSDKQYYESLEVLYSSDGEGWYTGGTTVFQSKELVGVLFNQKIKYLKIAYIPRYESDIGITIFGKNGVMPKEIDATDNFYTCGNMVDGDPSTRYSSGRPMEAGMAITYTFGEPQSLKGMGISYGESTNDYSRDMSIYIPDEYGEWKEIYHGINDKSNYISFDEPIETKQIKLVNNYTDESYYWSIAEIQFFRSYKISYPDTCSIISKIDTSTSNSDYLLDNDINTVWKSEDNGIQDKSSITIELIDGETILGFYLNSSHAPLKVALNATIYGSNDGVVWNDLTYKYGSQQDYVFDSPQSYKFYRIENEETSLNNVWEVSELRILQN